MTRSALKNGLPPLLFAYAQWPKEQVWTRDIDLIAPSIVRRAMQLQLGFSDVEVQGTTLAQYCGSLFNELHLNTKLPWVLPIGIRHRLHKAYGLQFCALCLRDENTRYFRVQARLGFVTTCRHHGVILHDRCWKCSAAVNPHRHSAGTALFICYNCGSDLCLATSVPACPRVVAFQQLNVGILRQGFAVFGRQSNLYGPIYFRILRQLCRLLLCGSAGQSLRDALYEPSVEPELCETIGSHPIVEELSPVERHDLLKMAARLVQSWPTGLIALCKSAHITSTAILKDMDEVPYSLEAPVLGHLSKKSYRIGEDEIAAAAESRRFGRRTNDKRSVRRFISTASQASLEYE